VFSIEKYKKLVNTLLSNSFLPTTNWNKELSSNTLLLRHDIDFDVVLAHKLAKLELSLGVRSTFFFMVSSNMYNIFSKRTQDLIKDIAQMGHHISIHFDATNYSNLDYFLIEKKAFEKLFGVEISIVSIHRPGPFLDNNNIKLCGINQTYQNIYFNKMRYISDSGGKDVFPAISDFIDSSEKKGLHLLIHPIWWMEDGKTPTETLNNWKEKNTNFISSEIRLNCKTYLD
jgi:hypothetical protein